MTKSIWKILGIEPTDNPKLVRRAYAKALKITHPEDDPQGFQQLRDAYERALSHVADTTEYEDDEFEETSEPGAGGNLGFQPTAEDATADDSQDATVDASEDEAPSREQEAYSEGIRITKAVLEALSTEGEAAAQSTLEAALHQPEMDNLLQRRGLEAALAEVLSELETLPLSLIGTAKEYFHWEEDAHYGLEERPYQVQDLMDRLHAHNYARELRQEGRLWGLKMFAFNYRPMAAALLMGPHRPRLFTLLWAYYQLRVQMALLLSEIDQLVPEVLEYEVNQSTRDWWEARTQRKSFAWPRFLNWALNSPWLMMLVVWGGIKGAEVAVHVWLEVGWLLGIVFFFGLESYRTLPRVMHDLRHRHMLLKVGFWVAWALTMVAVVTASVIYLGKITGVNFLPIFRGGFIAIVVVFILINRFRQKKKA